MLFFARSLGMAAPGRLDVPNSGGKGSPDNQDPPRPHRPLYRHLTRITSSGRFVPEIDGLRFVAISLVVLIHVHLYVAIMLGIPLNVENELVSPSGFNPLL